MYEPLHPHYKEQLDAIGDALQASEELAAYLESEELDDYNIVKSQFEPQIALLHQTVAEYHPLMLVPFEQELLDDRFEGLFLPKVLGYSVLRGEVSENFKYIRPQEHFKDVLIAIANNPNFDILKMRIGQSIQTGFALSSDIWTTNLIEEVKARRVRYYLQGQKLEKYRVWAERKNIYQRFSRQFLSENYQTAVFPTNKGELKVLFSELKTFLLYRLGREGDNGSLVPHIETFLNHADFRGSVEHLQVAYLYGAFFTLEEDQQTALRQILTEDRKAHAQFDQNWLKYTIELHLSKLNLDRNAELQVGQLMDRAVEDQLTEFYNLTDTIHTQGYGSDEAMEAVRTFYHTHPGTSLINECVRATVYMYFDRVFSNLTPQEYEEMFAQAKIYKVYVQIFLNQQFNQNLKDLQMKYVRKLIKTFTDKRGRDYQDIKKFVASTFTDLGFLTEKQVVELFKTRRKRRKKTEA